MSKLFKILFFFSGLGKYLLSSLSSSIKLSSLLYVIFNNFFILENINDICFPLSLSNKIFISKFISSKKEIVVFKQYKDNLFKYFLYKVEFVSYNFKYSSMKLIILCKSLCLSGSLYILVLFKLFNNIFSSSRFS